jgi:phosphoserine phosphatase
MSTVVCLISRPATMTLTPALVDRARRALPETEAEWLAEGEAVELGPLEMTPAEARRRVRDALDDAPLDVCALPFEGRRKRLLLADMDSTIIGVECIDELAAVVGIKDEVARITRRTMNGELDFEDSLTARVALLKGMAEAELERVAESRTPLNPGAATLVATMRAHGALTALVSGGFTFFTEHVRRRAGFDRHEANVLEIVDGRLSGRVLPPILGRSAKKTTLERLCHELGCTAEAALAIGDGANDLEMLAAAGLGVAYRAHQTVRAAVPVRLDVADLDGALYLQGYRRDEFVVA